MKFLIVLFVWFPLYQSIAQRTDEQNYSCASTINSHVDPQDNSIITEVESYYPRGFTTSFGRTIYYSSFSNYITGNYDFTIGFGYNISPQLLLGIKIYTGEEYSNTDRTHPVAGKFDLGGGAILLTYRLFDHGCWRPFITAGYELSTILTSAVQNTSIGSLPVTGTSGYNGMGLRTYAGTEFYISQNFALEGSMTYHYQQYTGLIINSENIGNKVTLADNSFGVGLGCNIYFNLLP